MEAPTMTTTPTADSPTSRRSRWPTVLLVTVCTVAALVVGVLTRPVAGPLPAAASGDQQLAAAARSVAGENRPALAVACVSTRPGLGTITQTAVIGTEPDARFEIGSISKGLTGLLLADMIERGEVTADQKLGTLLDVSGPLANVTLEQLATHHSGLPVQALTLRQAGRNYWAELTAGNPYGQSIQDRIHAADTMKLSSPPGTYSNVGFELLGAALAAAAGRPYPELLRERILLPIGMTDTIVPTDSGQLSDRDLSGETEGGRTADPWLGEAIGPAGGARADVADMASLARALLDRSAPGIDALKPKAEVDGDAIGWAWMTRPNPGSGRTVVWHNGGTGGFTSFIGIDTETKTAIVLLSAVGESPSLITGEGFQLLDRAEGCRS
jgi:CubicO group peptidase (beta-lactamase class C family)